MYLSRSNEKRPFYSTARLNFRRTSQHAEELALEAAQLSTVSGDLKELVGQFKI